MVRASRSGANDNPETEPQQEPEQEDEETENLNPPRYQALSVGSLVNLFQKQSSDGRSLTRFTGAGSREKVQSTYEEFLDRLITSTSDHEELFQVVQKLLRLRSTDPESAISERSMNDSRLKRILYSFLKVILAPPASLILSQNDLPRTMDGIEALRLIRDKYEPLKKTAFRKELILEVILLTIGDTTNPEPVILKWLKAIDHLKQAGCTSLDDLLKDILVTALPPPYSNLITLWDSSDEGASTVAQDKMIRDICTHFEHVVLPATPVGRKHANSAINRYKTRGDDRPPKGDNPKGNPKGKNSKQAQDREKSKQASAAQQALQAAAANQSLKDAQKRQRTFEQTKKFENVVCWVCGKKGHSPAYFGCEKHPEYKPKSASAVSPDEDASKQGMSARIIANSDGFVSFAPSSSKDPWADQQ
jgi:hypothetical protein